MGGAMQSTVHPPILHLTERPMLQAGAGRSDGLAEDSAED